ncbi:VOC family protein [Agromyces larvae]|uniref:Glyoxalase-like domain-containing protein n=1 Tax=Agromyces larvae TaxID=2929802 RepID=A0ABY4C2B8_9MICO|nr:VOC family protein [Agromyces larvae]UOE45577.1 hypothetical protein MTO99_07445 [Agromyces larvae]
MSDDDRLAFLRASGVRDWRVLYCGPIAYFATGSVRDGTRFTAALARLRVLRGHPPLIELAPDGVTVRLDRDILDLDAGSAIERAQAVSELARRHGLTARPDRVQDFQIAIATQLPTAEVLPFWRAILGYVDHGDDDLIDPLGRGPTVWFQPIDPAKTLRHAMHVDLAVPREQIRERLEAAAKAGSRAVHDGGVHWTRADAAGNKVDLMAWPDLAVPENARGGGPEIDAQLDGRGRSPARVIPSDHAALAAEPTLPEPSQPGPAQPEAAQIAAPRAAGDAAREVSGLADWTMLPTGPSAWFRTSSLDRSAHLADTFASLPGANRLHLDVRADGLGVRLARRATELREIDIDLMRTMSTTARDVGAESDPSSVQTVQLEIARTGHRDSALLA